ncbi:MAG TPA: beta-propeller fold lactonase family protein [Acidobacteriaceae bacterium]|jgi:6-phosphogluconolactonase (cycloisomerase 2 family)|nr:beta-propeller fold lactonase family protein [Acidobacteriaceae bacterium]
MKLTRIGQGMLAIAASLGVGLGIASCNPGDTIDYLFVTLNNASSSGNGSIVSYHVNSYSGALTAVAGSPFSSQGKNPVSEVATPNQKYLYVANHDSNNVAEFAIGTDGQLSAGKTYSTPGAEPVALAVNSTGTLLFVLDYYQAGYSDAKPGPGELMVYPISADGSLGTPVGTSGSSFAALQCFPTGVAVTPNGNYVFATNTNAYIVTTASASATPPATPSACPSQGTISGFSVGSSGALTAVAGSPFLAGTTPTGVAIDPTNRFLYATDSVQNQLIAYDILAGGVLYPLTNGPFQTETFPVGVVVDPRGKYIYVTDYNSSEISEFTIVQSTGSPSQLTSPSYGTKAPSPTCIGIDPALGRYVYTSDFSGAYVTGAELNPNTGALNGIQDSPYPVTGSPTCVALVPHGNHATQFVPTTSGNSGN